MSQGTDLLVAPCSYQAAKFAVEHWHYSHSLPATKRVSYGAWEGGEYIGCVMFSRGANNNMHKPYSLEMTECVELVRVALNSHASPASKIVSLSIKEFKKTQNIRLIVSYADPEYGHNGSIYQAMNWIYEGTVKCTTPKYLVNNKWVHARQANSLVGTVSGLESKPVKDKHKYLYPLDRAMRRQIEPLAQPYPKRQHAGD